MLKGILKGEWAVKDSNLKKPIIFNDKKAELKRKHKGTKLHIEHLNESHKVIGYNEHKRMKLQEAKREKIIHSKFYQQRKKIATIASVLVGIIIVSLLWDNVLKPSYLETSNNQFRVESKKLSSSDISTYSTIIKQSVQKHLDIKYPVNIENINKNGDLIFAKGFFTIPNKGDIYYNITLKNYSPSSLTVNGEEYIK